MQSATLRILHIEGMPEVDLYKGLEFWTCFLAFTLGCRLTRKYTVCADQVLSAVFRNCVIHRAFLTSCQSVGHVTRVTGRQPMRSCRMPVGRSSAA